MMDQRTGDRRVVSLDAVVGCSRFGLIRGEIIDLGLGGLYIRAETSIVPLGATVTVTFQPGPLICNSCLSVDGKVAHQSLHGFGIEFSGLEPHCTEALGRLLPAMPLVRSKAMPVLRALRA